MKRITWLLRLACLVAAAFIQWQHPLDLTSAPLVMLAFGGGSMVGKGYIDPLLSNFAISYAPDGLIAADVMPIVPVIKQSGVYAIFEQADQFRIPDTTRAPGDEAKIVRFRVGSGVYNCLPYALKSQIPIEDLANADGAFRTFLETGRIGTVMNQLMLDWENRTAALFFKTGNVGSSTLCASLWSTAGGGGSPFSDINTQIDNVQNATGIRPNTLIFGIQAWKDLRRHNEIINKTKSLGAYRVAAAGAAGMPSEMEVAELFEMDRVLVGRAYKNTAQELGALNLIPVWSAHCWVGHIRTGDQLTGATFASAFRWQVPGVPALQVERLPYRATIKAEELEVGYYQDERVTAKPLGNLITGVH